MGMLIDLCKQNGIDLCPVRQSEISRFAGISTTGLALELNGKKTILVDCEQSLSAQRFIIAHELGHHLLGHLAERSRQNTEGYETEANIFSAVILAHTLVAEYENNKAEVSHNV